MKKYSFVFAMLLMTVTGFAQTTWKADPAHSSLGFEITHLGIADVPGNFNEFEVNITSSKPDFSDAVVEFTGQVKSVDTRIEQRDNHLKSADFFDVEKYPTMSFKSSSVKKKGKNKFELRGDLTIKGITKPVTLTMNYRGTTESPMAKGTMIAGIEINGTIKRSDFAVGEKFPAPMLSDEVVIEADGEFVQK